MRNNKPECKLLKDYELMDKVIEAQRNHLSFIQFKHGNSIVKIKIKELYTEGIMRGNKAYYSK